MDFRFDQSSLECELTNLRAGMREIRTTAWGRVPSLIVIPYHLSQFAILLDYYQNFSLSTLFN